MRVRSVNNDVFGLPELLIDGVRVGDGALEALLGPVGEPSGGALLAGTPALVRATLAQLGARVAHVDLDELDRVLGGSEWRGGDGADALAKARGAARERVNVAGAALREARASAETSRRLAPSRAVRPEDISLLEADAAEATAKHTAWRLEEAAAVAAFDGASKAFAAHHDAERRMRAELAHVEGQLPAEAPMTASAAAGLVEAARVLAANVKSDLVRMSEDIAAAYRDVTHATSLAATARAALESVEGALALVRCDRCPTCQQSIPPTTVEAFERAAAAAAATRDLAQGDLVAATRYRDSLLADLPALQAEEEAAVRALMAASLNERRAAEARERVATAAGQRKRLHEHRASVPRVPSALEERVAEIRASRPRAEDWPAKIRAEIAAREAYKRWMADRAAVDAAEAAAAVAKAAEATLADIEERTVGAGAALLFGEAASMIPQRWQIVQSLGAIGLSDGLKSWSGPGLSTAQRSLLSRALDTALARINGARFRLVMVDDADVMSPSTLAELRDNLEVDLAIGAIDLALLTCCHPPPQRPGWQHVCLGLSAGPGPGPGSIGVDVGAGGWSVGAGAGAGPEPPLARPGRPDRDLDAEGRDRTQAPATPATPCAPPAPLTGLEGVITIKDEAAFWNAVTRGASPVRAPDPTPAQPRPEPGPPAAAADTSPPVPSDVPSDNDTHKPWGSPPNAYRVRGVVQRLPSREREALELMARSSAPTEAWHHLEACGFAQDGQLTEAGGAAALLVRGEPFGGLLLAQLEPPPPPSNATHGPLGLSEKDARRVIRDEAVGVVALRALLGDAGADSPGTQVAVERLARFWWQLGYDEARARAELQAAAAAHPKNARGGEK